MKHLSKSLEETNQIAKDFLGTLSPGKEATIVALQGDLGSGKTAFTQEAGKILGITENMHSPTFVLMKIYKLKDAKFKHLFHIDAYRMEDESELGHLGWQDIIKEPENLIFIEWPERVPGALPQSAETISFKFIGEGTREIVYEN